MNKSWLLLLVVVIGLGAGMEFLLHWNIPAPTQHVEKVLPDGMFPK